MPARQSPAPAFIAIDPETLAKHFDSQAAELRWQAVWSEQGVYHYDPRRSRQETFVVDTPPPTVSGSLHLGHVFSYTHADVLARQQRMTGRNIFYPMGWDDNGLPTERRVQNFFHVRCNPEAPYEEGLTLAEATDAERKAGPPRVVSRKNFIELCQRVTEEDEQAFMTLWKRVGLSVDWRQQYATIGQHCRIVAQRSFLDLVRKGHAYQVEAPTMWDVDFQTAVAQAELEDRPKQGAFHSIEFAVEGSDQSFVIATTRPELLPACVGVTAHPEDERYRHLFGKRAVTPLFHVPVPIFASELADPAKGSGILMVCTFGDATDVHWWREHGLALRQVLNRQGRFQPLQFGEAAFASLRPEQAQQHYDELVGKSVNAARKRVVELLREPHGSATGRGAPLQAEPVPVQQAVKYFEKGDQPLEFMTTRQWFVRLVDKKAALLDKGRQIHWHPEFMRSRYENWTENLALDWCISRQRYFGVPFPVWYPLDAQGQPRFEAPIFAAEATLPVDPLSDTPPGFTPQDRHQPGGFIGEGDVFDTWFTSSMTPQIGSHWGLDDDRHAKLFPADIRPQSHEIIRTWAFYTIAKAMLHDDQAPWQHVVISGWILDPDRKKMSKSKGNVVTPMHLLEQYGADALRYWASSARLGTDTAFDEQVLKVGKRLVTKLFNAGKFVLQQTATMPANGTQVITAELDRAFVAKLRDLVQRSTASFAEFEFARALAETESFFWGQFTDAYLELAKNRARRGELDDPDRVSAVATLRLGLSVLLRLLAPALPFITEEVWSWAFAAETERPSIHRAPWPTLDELATVPPPATSQSFDLAVGALAAIHKHKSENGMSVGRPIEHLVAALRSETRPLMTEVLSDVQDAARCAALILETDDRLEPAAFVIRSAAWGEANNMKSFVESGAG